MIIRKNKLIFILLFHFVILVDHVTAKLDLKVITLGRWLQ